MQFRLRTLLIVLAVEPMMIALAWFLLGPREQTLPEGWIGVQDTVFPAMPGFPRR